MTGRDDLHAYRRMGAVLAILGALLPATGRAGVMEFVDGCMAHIAHPAGLPAALKAAGLAEVDPANGPQGPAIATDAPGRRLWSGPTRPGRVDAFTGYAPASSGRPFAICWHVSRPGESGAVSIAELRRRYPPREGSVDAGTEFFYGGFARWLATIGGEEMMIGVSWPMRDRPEEGTAFLYAARPTAPD